MSDCIFCKIIRKQIPSHIIYEDDEVIAILDHRPVRTGHAMVIPKLHVDHFLDLEDRLVSHICLIAKLLGKRIMGLLRPKRIGFAVAGFGVPHAHYHIVPMWDDHDVTSARYAVVKNDSVVFTMDHIAIADDIEQSNLAKSLRNFEHG